MTVVWKVDSLWQWNGSSCPMFPPPLFLQKKTILFFSGGLIEKFPSFSLRLIWTLYVKEFLNYTMLKTTYKQIALFTVYQISRSIGRLMGSWKRYSSQKQGLECRFRTPIWLPIGIHISVTLNKAIFDNLSIICCNSKTVTRTELILVSNEK